MDLHATNDPIHPLPSPTMSLPFGLWLASLGADVMFRSGRAPAPWDDAAFFGVFAGLVAALLLAGPGLVDEVLAGTRVHLRRPGRFELHVAVIGLYVANLGLRAWEPSTMLPVGLSFAGITLLVLSAGVGREAAHAPATHQFPDGVLIVTRPRRTARSA
jgi:uncharacterized membrane protein